MMGRQAYRMEYEFEKECINQMARSTLRKYQSVFDTPHNTSQQYSVQVKIGHGFTYSKYNTLMHFLNVIQCYWQNPDLNNIQVFGKDIRAVLAVSCQKIFFEKGHTYYHYGPIELKESYRACYDLSMSNQIGDVVPGVSREKPRGTHTLIVTDRVYEFDYLKDIVVALFKQAQGVRLKTDNVVLNLTLLSLLLDFGLYEEYSSLLNLPFLTSLKHGNDKRQLQVEVSNLIHEFDKKNTADSVTRIKVHHFYRLLYATSPPYHHTPSLPLPTIYSPP
jgi:hypothetical protein